MKQYVRAHRNYKIAFYSHFFILFVLGYAAQYPDDAKILMAVGMLVWIFSIFSIFAYMAELVRLARKSVITWLGLTFIFGPIGVLVSFYAINKLVIGLDSESND